MDVACRIRSFFQDTDEEAAGIVVVRPNTHGAGQRRMERQVFIGGESGCRPKAFDSSWNDADHPSPAFQGGVYDRLILSRIERARRIGDAPAGPALAHGTVQDEALDVL